MFAFASTTTPLEEKKVVPFEQLNTDEAKVVTNKNIFAKPASKPSSKIIIKPIKRVSDEEEKVRLPPLKICSKTKSEVEDSAEADGSEETK